MINDREIRRELALMAAKQMAMAARTAPKAKGMDLIETGIADSPEELEALAENMEKLYEQNHLDFFLRDAANIRKADAVVLIGIRKQALGLNCGYCGAPSCGQKNIEAPCAFNAIDVGIAVGSACAAAAGMHVDCRVMYSAGHAAATLGWPTSTSCQVIAIPLSVSSKNPFFDRQPQEKKNQ